MEMKITNENFEKEVLQADKTVLADFYADWCGPCKMLSPVLHEIAEENADTVKVVKINVDEQPQLAGRFQVSSIPLLLLKLELRSTVKNELRFEIKFSGLARLNPYILCLTSPTIKRLLLLMARKNRSCLSFMSWYSSIIISLNLFLICKASSVGSKLPSDGL